MTSTRETGECLACGTSTKMFHVGSAAVGGQKSASYDESVAAKRFDHDLLFCPSCTLTRYAPNAGVDEILDDFYKSQPSTYGLLPPADAYLTSLAKRICEQADSSGAVLEIGCNDGALLCEFKTKHAHEVIGVEPSRGFQDIWDQRGLSVINGFFSADVIPELQGREIAAIVIRHVLEHIADPVDLLANVAQLMGDKTLLVIESPYLPTVIEKGRFENISYAHLNHFTTRAIDCMCAPLGIGIGSVDLVDTDGGSFVAYLRKGTVTPDGILDSVTGDDLQRFLVRMQQNGDRIRDALSGFSPNEVVGYGAGAKGPFLVSLYELGPMLHAVVDDNVSFHDQYLAGTGTRIVPSSVLEDDAVKAVLILAPTHADSILASLPAGKTAINII